MGNTLDLHNPVTNTEIRDIIERLESAKQSICFNKITNDTIEVKKLEDMDFNSYKLLDDTSRLISRLVIELKNAINESAEKSPELEHCPHCGGMVTLWSNTHGETVYAVCMTCGIRTLEYNDPEDAIMAWNK